MKRLQLSKGFTLVELLVVIAIITILASIVVPNVTDWIGRARVAKAVSEINSAELALTKMLSDAQKNSFAHLLKNPDQGPDEGFNVASTFYDVAAAEHAYTQLFYILLRRGKDARMDNTPVHTGWGNEFFPASSYLRHEEVKRLGDSYMDLGKDPWGNLYRFFPGPLRSINNYVGARGDYLIYPMPFRSYNVELDVPGHPEPDAHTVDVGIEHPVGYPAPEKLPIYIYSCGGDMTTAQALYFSRTASGTAAAYSSDLVDQEHMGGGDDINNWDNAASWDEFY